MTRLGVLSNPGSRRNRRGLGELRDLLDAAPNARHVVLETIGQVPEILAGFARDGVEVVAVAGGDGTVQAVLTEYYGRRSLPEVPKLAVVPRGTANMIAADAGLRRRGLEGLKRILSASAEELEAACLPRRILRVDNVLNAGPQCGMFFGGAGICRAIEAYRSKVHPMRLESDTAAAVTLAGLLGRWLLGRPRADDRIFYGDPVTLRVDGGAPVESSSLIILATTLERLILGSRPFWGGGTGALRFTEIAYPPERLLRYARRVLYGGENRHLPESSYRSWSAQRVEVQMDCRFTLDGEFFEPTPGLPLVLTAADEARFVCPRPQGGAADRPPRRL
jgi:diacylglycerol kinase family enzyme